jgi:putative ABC transport system permease protein
MNTRRRKIRGDFLQHRLQIGLIGLVLILGTAGVVAALNARAILRREIARSYENARSPDLALWFDRVDAPLLAEVRAQPGVAEVDARHVASTRVASATGPWLPTRLLIVRDFADQRTGIVHRHDGAWPTGDSGLFIEQSSLPLLGLAVGDPLRVRSPGGGTVILPIAGVLHDTAVAPSTQERIIYAYVTPAAAAKLGQNADLDQLTVLMEDRSDGPADLANSLRDFLTAKGNAPVRVEVLPHSHPHALLMDAMLRVLGVMAAMAFTCSAALAAFVVSLWMKREVRQVGIMKTIGARSHQLAFQYLALVGPLVVSATLLALPLGALAGRGLVGYYETSLNIDVISRAAPTGLWLSEILGALAIPLIAMTVPIVRAARMTAREAIQDPGITGQTAPRILAAKLLRLPGHSQWTFALRNTVRRPWRLALTMLALTAGGALLLTAGNLYKSLMRVVDLSLAEQGHDIEVSLPRAVPGTRLEEIARRIPGVTVAEAWRRTGVGVIDPASTLVREPRRFGLTAYPQGTQLLTMPIKEGRWPQPGETDAIVVTRFIQHEIPGLHVGSDLELSFHDRRKPLHVVGVVEEVATPMLYTNFPAFESVTALGDASSDLRVKTTSPDTVVPALDEALLDARIYVGQIQTRADRREVLDEHFSVVVSVANMIALATALVGGICLAAFASLTVLERAREIGVIRTLGATPRTVLRLFLAESAVLAALSALLAVAVSVPATQALNAMTSRLMLQVAVPLVFSWPALALLGSGVLVVMLGVWLPVSRMLRISVRETLAYE